MTNRFRITIAVAIGLVAGYILGINFLKLRTWGVEHTSILSYDTVPRSLDVTRTVILNTLADKYGHQRYLEIGLGDREQNHDWIKCPIRIAVDPYPDCKAAYQMTSDEFFEINSDNYDLIFVDGHHTKEQAHKDIISSLEVLNKNGTIVVHDCNPSSKAIQTVPPTQKDFSGDVWKAWVRLRSSRDDLKMYVVDADFGCGVIRRGTQSTIALPENLTYEELDRNRVQWLNLVSTDWFVKEMRANSPVN